jgi:hypothetical protein
LVNRAEVHQTGRITVSFPGRCADRFEAHADRQVGRRGVDEIAEQLRAFIELSENDDVRNVLARVLEVRLMEFAPRQSVARPDTGIQLTCSPRHRGQIRLAGNQ